MIIAGTGHRKIQGSYDTNNYLCYWIKDQLNNIIDQYKPDLCISGGAITFDTIWSLTVLERKIPLLVCIPCLNQESRWNQKSQKLYWEILNNPLCQRYYVSKYPYQGRCMQKRDEYMVDKADILVAYLEYKPSGTSTTVEYAKRLGKHIEYINPKDFYEK